MWAESLFDNTRSAIARSIEGIVHFMCTKVSLPPSLHLM